MFGHIMLAHFFVKWLISKLEQVEKGGKKKRKKKGVSHHCKNSLQRTQNVSSIWYILI